jgi:uncharacterized membrane protein YfcA
MSLDPILAVLSIIFGILVLVFNNLLEILVGLFFILLGLWLLYEWFIGREKKSTSAPPPTQTAQERMPPAQK